MKKDKVFLTYPFPTLSSNSAIRTIKIWNTRLMDGVRLNKKYCVLAINLKFPLPDGPSSVGVSPSFQLRAETDPHSKLLLIF